MIQNHVCLSNRPNQLLRWQEAFPKGRIVSNQRALEPLLTLNTLVWLHIDTVEEGALASIAAAILNQSSEIKLIAISSVPDPVGALECLQLGISGYCHALSAPPFFKKVATVVSSGGYWLGETIVQRLAISLKNQLKTADADDTHKSLALLSAREHDVAMQVRQGAANKEIADALAITERTVKAHLSSIFQKLGIRNRLQLLILLSKDSD